MGTHVAEAEIERGQRPGTTVATRISVAKPARCGLGNVRSSGNVLRSAARSEKFAALRARLSALARQAGPGGPPSPYQIAGRPSDIAWSLVSFAR
jgi:hypothetical protein